MMIVALLLKNNGCSIVYTNEINRTRLLTERRKKKRDNKGYKGQLNVQVNVGAKQEQKANGRCRSNALK